MSPEPVNPLEPGVEPKADDGSQAVIPPPSLMEQNNALLISIDNKLKDHGLVLAAHTAELQAIKQAVTSIDQKTT